MAIVNTFGVCFMGDLFRPLLLLLLFFRLGLLLLLLLLLLLFFRLELLLLLLPFLFLQVFVERLQTYGFGHFPGLHGFGNASFIITILLFTIILSPRQHSFFCNYKITKKSIPCNTQFIFCHS
jgi:hypothetical protein